ncbi:MAG: hypothetical protein CMN78_03405 [Spirochaetales bacterium]|nr:hypothetical protein [Spirochaetales bacterium]
MLEKEKRKDLNRLIGNWFADQRSLCGLTQADVASMLGQSQSYISKIENGEQRLDLLEYADLCNALGVDPVDLVKNLGALINENK